LLRPPNSFCLLLARHRFNSLVMTNSNLNAESSVLDFVQSLQEIKKTQSKWASTEISLRAESLMNVAQKLSAQAEQLAQALAAAEHLPFDFVLQNQILPSARLFDQVARVEVPSHLNPKPTGLISILLPEHFSFRLFAERLAPALLAGNAVSALFPSGSESSFELWKTFLDPAWPVRLYRGGNDLGDILAAHPAVQAVSYYGTAERAETVLKNVAGSWKKWQITGGYHNSALVLSDADFTEAAKQLATSCFTGMGQLHWNISTILVTEAQLPDFQNEFVRALEAMKFETVTETVQTRLAGLRAQLKSENAKVIFDGGEGRPLVVQDLSHCSTLQQDCLAAPVVLISPVKYAHEMVKWANTSYFGMSAQIFGSAEKVLKFGTQLDVSQVSGNAWLEAMTTLPLGLKQSFSGIPDLSPFGNFFSDLRKIDGTESKK
jgi:aminomuconate-semialdehyde/2-hydroxymuconate-6-semialdehyde dehydrogenase